MDCAAGPFFQGTELGALRTPSGINPLATGSVLFRGIKSAYCLNPGSPFAARHFFKVSLMPSAESSVSTGG